MAAGVSNTTYFAMEVPITGVCFSVGMPLSGESPLEMVGSEPWA